MFVVGPGLCWRGNSFSGGFGQCPFGGGDVSVVVFAGEVINGEQGPVVELDGGVGGEIMVQALDVLRSLDFFPLLGIASSEERSMR